MLGGRATARGQRGAEDLAVLIQRPRQVGAGADEGEGEVPVDGVQGDAGEPGGLLGRAAGFLDAREDVGAPCKQAADGDRDDGLERVGGQADEGGEQVNLRAALRSIEALWSLRTWSQSARTAQ